MKYIALLRGINVGGNRKVEMRRLKALFESLGCNNVSTYINSGNIFFEMRKDSLQNIRQFIETKLNNEFGFEIPTLIKATGDMAKIAASIPEEWQNNATWKTDVAYLFPEIDSKESLGLLPVTREYIDIRYVKGAICWNLDKKDYNKSHLNKIVAHQLYQYMTVRNVNTARFLANWKS